MKLFNLSPRTLLLVLLFAALGALGLAIPQCHAMDAPYVQLSAGSTVVRGETPVLDVTFTTPSSQLRNAYWQGSLTVIGASNFREHAVPNNFAVRGLFVDGFGHLDVGLGLSWMQNPYPYNGSPVNFALQLAYRFERIPVTLTYGHMSNAGSREPNLGRDMVLIGYRFK